RTAALVTPDRALARRVAVALGRWDITAENSGGEALADTPAGIFARLAALVALDGTPPVDLLALLKHPLLRLDFDRRGRAVAALERTVLRGPRPRPGTGGLARALENFRSQFGRLRRRESSELHPSDPRIGLHDADLADAVELVERLRRALAPLEAMDAEAMDVEAMDVEAMDEASHPLAEFAVRHRTVLGSLSTEKHSEAALSGADGQKIADALEELATSNAAARLLIAKSDYVELFIALLAARIVRPTPRLGAQVRILGPLEARLTDSDRVVLGGLVEGTWPPESNSDAWLSRRMRLELGLDLPERRIGLSAHDFAQLFNAREVFLTRAAKI